MNIRTHFKKLLWYAHMFCLDYDWTWSRAVAACHVVDVKAAGYGQHHLVIYVSWVATSILHSS